MISPSRRSTTTMHLITNLWNVFVNILVITNLAIVKSTSVDISEYVLTEENSIWNLTQGSFLIRSLLECSTKCSELEHACAFNYIRQTSSITVNSKTCNCILEINLVHQGGLTAIEGAVFYVREGCKSIYEIAVSTTPTSGQELFQTTAGALVCTENSTYVFRDGNVLMYSSYNTLTSGPNTAHTLSSTFTGSSYPVEAAFTDGSHIYLVKGSDVWKYSSDQLAYTSTQSTSSLFGGDSDSDDDSDNSFDAILQSGTRTYLFMGTTLRIVENGEVSVSTSLESNGDANPYKSDNFIDRPQQIQAGCSVDSDRHVFISEGSVYLFTFSTRHWDILGNFIVN